MTKILYITLTVVLNVRPSPALQLKGFFLVSPGLSDIFGKSAETNCPTQLLHANNGEEAAAERKVLMMCSTG